MNLPLSTLIEFLRIPSVSTQPEFFSSCLKAQDFLVQQFTHLGFSTQILPSTVHNAVFASSPINPKLPTLLIYGHYDVQPAGAPSQWTSPPFTPTIRKNRIYARGATDNKGQIMIHIMAAQQLISQYGITNLPLNLKFIIEGEEEIGSPGVEQILHSFPQLLSADCVLISDTEMIAPKHPSIDISLRGVMDIEIGVQTGTHDVHSGQFGGLAPNAALILTNILHSLKNGHGKISIPGFYQDIAPLTDQEITDFKHLEPPTSNIIKEGHLYYLTSAEPGLSLNRRRWSEPTLDITGFESGYTGFGTKSIIPHFAEAKISMRIVPNQNPDKIYRQTINYIQKIAPKQARLSFFLQPPALPYKAPTNHPVFNLAKQVLKQVFKHQPVFVGQGGSIGFVPVLGQKLQVPCLLIGFGLADENLHAPNEHFSLENYEQGITAMTLLYSQFGQLPRNNVQV